MSRLNLASGGIDYTLGQIRIILWIQKDQDYLKM